jgi:23S rRNA pseudouridine2605 synthase
VSSDATSVTVDGEKIFPRRRDNTYIILYKPRGYVTTAKDELGRKCVTELVAKERARLFPVGRLDKDSEGLLLMTNDGALANALTHPSHQIAKMYRVTVHPKAEEEQIIALSNGVYLDDGSKTLPAVIRVVAEDDERTVMEMSIREGKNRQIRRMCDAVGLEVARLSRKSIGAVKLGMLQPGKYRELKPSEVLALKGAAQKASRQKRAKKYED